MMSRGGISVDHNADAHDNNRTSQAALAESYRQMAADIEHEKDAEEWAEALVGDAFGVDQELAQ
jgi:hypothetical protein